MSGQVDDKDFEARHLARDSMTMRLTSGDGWLSTPA